MKKFIALLLAVLMLLSCFVGCAKKEAGTEETQDSSTAAKSDAAEETKESEPAEEAAEAEPTEEAAEAEPTEEAAEAEPTEEAAEESEPAEEAAAVEAPEETAEAEAAEETAEAEAAEEDKLPFEGVKLVYWDDTFESADSYDATAKNIKKWEEMTGAEVEYHAYGDDMSSLLLPALESGEQLDIYRLDSVAQAGSNLQYALDITDMVGESGIEEKFSPIYMDQIRNWIDGADGKVYGLPTLCSFNAVWYNKEAFEEAGITETPKTMAEFEAACQALVKAGYNPIAQDAPYTFGALGVHLQNWLGEGTVSNLIVNGGWAKNGKAVKALQQIINWRKNGFFDPDAPSKWPASQNKIGLTKENAMIYTGTWLPGEVEEITGANLDWGCFLYPMPEEGSGINGAYLSNSVMTINKNCENPEAAFSFICYMTTDEADKAFSKAAECIPGDINNAPISCFEEAPDLLANCEGAIHYDGGLLANSAIKKSVADFAVNLYSGKFKNGMEAAKALDALIK